MANLGGMFQKKSDRPRIRPERTGLDKGLWFLAITFALSLLVYGLIEYPKLPATIPSKNGTSPSWTFLIMPTLGAGVIGMMLLIQRWPWMSNTIVAITEENAEIQYRLVNQKAGIGRLIEAVVCLLTRGQVVGATPSGFAGFLVDYMGKVSFTLRP